MRVLGVDLSPIQPKWTAPNVKFEIDDIEAEWSFTKRFDFIMGRYLMNGLRNYKAVIEQAYNNVNPGGWVKFQDMEITMRSDDDTLRQDSQIVQLTRIAMMAHNSCGVEHSPGPKLKGWFEQVGFVNIQHHVVKLPWGFWPKDPVMKEIGVYNLQQFLNGIEAFALQPLRQVLGWKEEEFMDFMERVRKELKDPKIHGYYDLHVACGQKPSG